MNAYEKILLLGATGTAGSAISKKLLSDTAITVCPPSGSIRGTTVINGDAENISGARFCAISGDALPKIAGNIVAAMSESSERLIFMGAVGIYNETDEIDGGQRIMNRHKQPSGG